MPELLPTDLRLHVVALDFEQRQRATQLTDPVYEDPSMAACELIALRDEVERLRDALVKAVAVAQAWHNQGIPVRECSKLWDIYWRSSPEMKPIREALTALDVPEKNHG